VSSAVLHADKILAELDALWVSLGRDEASGDSQGVLRACAMTLVVFTDKAEEPSVAAAILGELIREHPNRAVVVRVRFDIPVELDYRVVAQCWTPFGRRQQICCEQIELTAGHRDLHDLPAILLALAAPDLPLVVWCRGQRVFLSGACPLESLRPAKVILDSSAFGEPGPVLNRMAAEAGSGRALADLSWTRLTRWREIVAQEFETSPERAGGIERVRVFYSGAGVPATAYYLAGWILSASGRDAEVLFEAKPATLGGTIEGIEIEAGGQTISARRVRGSAVEVEAAGARNRSGCPRLDEAGLLAEELAITGRDLVFERALAVAARLAAR
jgi:glucose-6-phosphate dehydrogenase assembly protein OpcA